QEVARFVGTLERGRAPSRSDARRPRGARGRRVRGRGRGNRLPDRRGDLQEGPDCARRDEGPRDHLFARPACGLEVWRGAAGRRIGVRSGRTGRLRAPRIPSPPVTDGDFSLLVFTLRVAAISTIAILPAGLAAGWTLARWHGRGRAIVETALSL